jgi:hypothetical protein
VSKDIAKVIIPKFVDYDSDIKYFIPRFAKIQNDRFNEVREVFKLKETSPNNYTSGK